MEQPTVHSYKDLIVWQKSMDLVAKIYQITSKLPSEEQFGLVTQVRRSAVSIPSNIAEGRGRGTKKDYASFLRTAYSSASELETQILIIEQLKLAKGKALTEAKEQLTEVLKMLFVMIRNMSTSPRKKVAKQAVATTS